MTNLLMFIFLLFIFLSITIIISCLIVSGSISRIEEQQELDRMLEEIKNKEGKEI